jgi:hypothetical protein
VESIELQEEIDLDDDPPFISTISKTSTTSSSPTTSITNSSNSSLSNIKENRLNVKDIVSTSQLKTDKSIKKTYIRDENQSSNSFMSDHTATAVLTLLMLILIVAGILLFLIFSAKQRWRAEAMIYKTHLQMESRYGDQSIMSGYMDPNLINPNVHYQSRNHLLYQLNNVPRISDNSMAHLLLNTSAASNNIILPPPPLIPSSIYKTKQTSDPNEAYDYISDDKMKVNKLNEQSAQENKNEYTIEPSKPCNIISLDIPKSQFNERPLTSSTSLSNSQSPSISPKSLSELVTSTPSAPKTNEYDTLSKKSSPSDSDQNKKTRKDLNEYYDDSYQVPSNLPKFKN